MTFGVEYTRAEPYSRIGGGPPRPYLPVRLRLGERTVDTIGLIDSGADGSFFNVQFAQYLGLTLDPSAASASQGVGGTAATWQLDRPGETVPRLGRLQRELDALIRPARTRRFLPRVPRRDRRARPASATET